MRLTKKHLRQLILKEFKVLLEEEGDEEKTQEEVNDENSNPKTEEATS